MVCKCYAFYIEWKALGGHIQESMTRDDIRQDVERDYEWSEADICCGRRKLQYKAWRLHQKISTCLFIQSDASVIVLFKQVINNWVEHGYIGTYVVFSGLIGNTNKVLFLKNEEN